MASPQVLHYAPGGREHGGGIGRMIGYIQDAAARNGARHAVIDTRGPRWSWLGSPWRLSAALAILAWSRAAAPWRIHHIHVAGRGSTARKLVLAAAARGLGCIHVLHLHDYDYAREIARRPPWLRRRIARMFQGADRVVVLGHRDRETVERQLGVPAQRIAVMPNCVPDPGPRPAVRRHAEDPVTILFLGRLSERKGVPELLCALSAPEMADLPWRAILAGDGPVEAYREEARRLGLQSRVEMPGWLGEAKVRDLCRGADVLVLPSHAEGLAMSVLEGLAHGLAVVTTRVGAHEEVLSDGATGLFVPVGDAAALSETLARLIRDPGVRCRLSRSARLLFQERFGIEGYARRLDALYRSLATQQLQAVGAE